MATPDQVLLVDAYQQLSPGNRNAVQRAFERGNPAKAGAMLQKARQAVAENLADTRLEEIIADGTIDLNTELDELI